MTDWNPEKYLQFKAQRTQPALDLAERARRLAEPRTIVDVGCGPGNSTAVLRQVFPQAEIAGIDSSPAMIEKARAEHPEFAFACRGAEELTEQFDLLFSNACLQWIPRHEDLLPRLMERLTPGGVLAVQVPENGEEPLFRIIREVAADPCWGLAGLPLEHNEVLSPEEYFDVLSRCASSFDLWETVYVHPMPSHRHLIDWVRGTRLRPYLSALDGPGQAAFEGEILRRVEETYPLTETGEVLLRFRRLFFTARSKDRA